MNCTKCGRELEAGASFCGNCGQPVALPVVNNRGFEVNIANSTTNGQQIVAPAVEGGGKAIASLVLGILGIVAWVIPILGLIVGILSVVFGSMTVKSNKKPFAVAGIILGSICIIASLFLWGFVISESINEYNAGSYIMKSLL